MTEAGRSSPAQSGLHCQPARSPSRVTRCPARAGMIGRRRFRADQGTVMPACHATQAGLPPRPMARVMTSFMISLVPP